MNFNPQLIKQKDDIVKLILQNRSASAIKLSVDRKSPQRRTQSCASLTKPATGNDRRRVSERKGELSVERAGPLGLPGASERRASPQPKAVELRQLSIYMVNRSEYLLEEEKKGSPLRSVVASEGSESSAMVSGGKKRLA